MSTNTRIILQVPLILCTKTKYYLQHNELKRMDSSSRQNGVTASAALPDVTRCFLKRIKYCPCFCRFTYVKKYQILFLIINNVNLCQIVVERGCEAG